MISTSWRLNFKKFWQFSIASAYLGSFSSAYMSEYYTDYSDYDENNPELAGKM